MPVFNIDKDLVFSLALVHDHRQLELACQIELGLEDLPPAPAAVRSLGRSQGRFPQWRPPRRAAGKGGELVGGVAVPRLGFVRMDAYARQRARFRSRQSAQRAGCWASPFPGSGLARFRLPRRAPLPRPDPHRIRPGRDGNACLPDDRMELMLFPRSSDRPSELAERDLCAWFHNTLGPSAQCRKIGSRASLRPPARI